LKENVMSPDIRSSPVGQVRGRPSFPSVAALVSILLIAACAGASGNAGAAKLQVTSSIADRAVLTDPVSWTATVTGVSTSDAIDRVDFSIDGSIAWTERNAPYTFNDDGYLLVNAVLTPGSHLLAIDAVTASGAEAKTRATVTTTRPPVPNELLDRGFVRYRPAGGPTPAGEWRIEFDVDGVIRINDAGGGRATEAFIATSDGGLTLYGPTNWIVPESERGGFCDEPENVAKMHWQPRGTELVISAVGTDNCNGRVSFFAGTWKVKA
jgi:hypothetical protein